MDKMQKMAEHENYKITPRTQPRVKRRGDGS